MQVSRLLRELGVALQFYLGRRQQPPPPSPSSTNMITFVVLLGTFLCQWFIYFGSCSSTLVSLAGFAGLQMLSTVLVIVGSALIVPTADPERVHG